MSEKINWSLNVQIASGPKIGVSGNLDVDAYDVIKVVIPARGKAVAGKPDEPAPVTVEIQPGTTAGQVQFLLIQSSVYSTALTYKVKGASNEIALDQMHLFMGSGAVGTLGDPPTSLVFSNAIRDSKTGEGTEVSIQIYVGRKATVVTPSTSSK